MRVTVHGKGSVIPLQKPERTCKVWKLQVSVGYDGTGKYKKKSKRFHGTKTQAYKELHALISELEAMPENYDSTMTFEDYSAQWLKRRESSVRKGTQLKDKNRIDNLNLYLGKAKLCDIDEDMVKHTMDCLASKGGKSGKPLSGTSCQGTFATLGAILEDATKRKIISSNPCRSIDGMNRPKNDTREKDALTLEEARMLSKELLKGDPKAHTVGALLALMCGLSREELTAIRWCDVEFESSILRIEHANTAYEEGLVETKNRYRHRYIPLDKVVIQRLIEWRDTQDARLKAKGITVNLQTPVVSNPVGELMHPEAFAKWWRRYRKKLGLESYGLHQLRHTYASILCASGTDIITASRMMGHGDTSMLSRVYAHMVPEYAREASRQVSSVLSGNEEVSLTSFVNP